MTFGWHSTRKRKERNTAEPNDEDWKTTLPLGWTRMQRSDLCPRPNKRREMSSRDSMASDATAPGGSSSNVVVGESTSDAGAASNVVNGLSLMEGTNISSSSSLPSSKTSFTTSAQGQVVFCLHDWNPAWIQGYFFPSTTSLSGDDDDDDDTMNTNIDSFHRRGGMKPWRLLAVQEEIDECLACEDGGYRRLTLTVYHDDHTNMTDTTATTTTTAAAPQKTKISGVEWTGGDMMDLYDASKSIDMKAERLLTGEQCLGVLNKYFKGLVHKLKKSCQVDDDTSELDFLPNLAIVIGSMSIRLSHSKKHDEPNDESL